MMIYVRNVPRWVAWLLTIFVSHTLPPRGPYRVAFVSEQDLASLDGEQSHD